MPPQPAAHIIATNTNEHASKEQHNAHALAFPRLSMLVHCLSGVACCLFGPHCCLTTAPQTQAAAYEFNTGVLTFKASNAAGIAAK